MAELTYCCASCGSERIIEVRGEFPTGVVAPDGGVERREYVGLKCLECGEVEEL